MKQKMLALMLGMTLLLTVVPANAESDVVVGPAVGIASGTDIVVPSEPVEAAPETEAQPEEEPAVPEEGAEETPAEPEESDPAEDEPAESEPTEAPAEDAEETETPARVSAYERDENGNLVLDGAGNPIPILRDGATKKPVAWQRDEHGALVLDAWGEPIATQYVDIAAERIATIEDVLNPARRIDIYARWSEDGLFFGEEATLIAALQGYDGVTYALQWQTCAWESMMAAEEGEEPVWTAVPGANGNEYSLTVTEENYLDFWRVQVTVTGVEKAS